MTIQDANFQGMSTLSNYDHYKTNKDKNTITHLSAGCEGVYKLESLSTGRKIVFVMFPEEH